VQFGAGECERAAPVRIPEDVVRGAAVTESCQSAV
jgi:hypothetical protein